MTISEDKLRIITLSMERCRVLLVRIVVDLSINDTVVKPVRGGAPEIILDTPPLNSVSLTLTYNVLKQD